MNNPPLSEIQRQQVLEAVRACEARATARLGHRPPPVEVRFDLRGRAAGQFRLQRRGFRGPERWIRFNPWVFAADFAHHLAETVPHEVAHYLVSLQHPKARPHGPEWAAWMRFFGREPRATGSYSLEGVPVRRQRRHPYACGCPGRIHPLSTTRHNRILRGTLYLCPDCRAPLVPVTSGGI